MSKANGSPEQTNRQWMLLLAGFVFAGPIITLIGIAFWPIRNQNSDKNSERETAVAPEKTAVAKSDEPRIVDPPSPGLERLKDRGASLKFNEAGEWISLWGAILTDLDLQNLDHCHEKSTLESVDLGIVFGAKITDNGIRHLSNLTNLKYLTFEGSHAGLSPDGLDVLSTLPQLESLTIGVKSNACLEKVGEAKSIRNLSVFGSKAITDSGLEGLAKLSQLTSLHLFSVTLNGDGIAHLRSLPLSELTLQSNNISAKSLRELGSLRSLTGLNIDCNQVDDSCLPSIGKLLNLKRLSFGVDIDEKKMGGLLTDNGIKHLEKLEKLEVLSLTGHKAITDASLTRFAKMKKLRNLFTGGTSVTKNGAKSLKSWLPDCEITFGTSYLDLESL
ncbi:hypothetical protein OAE37_00095 [Pirellulaceae bacterium]|nr:hypothetical protein [Pirellulaceae bacterium]